MQRLDAGGSVSSFGLAKCMTTHFSMSDPRLPTLSQRLPRVSASSWAFSSAPGAHLRSPGAHPEPAGAARRQALRPLCPHRAHGQAVPPARCRGANEYALMSLLTAAQPPAAAALTSARSAKRAHLQAGRAGVTGLDEKNSAIAWEVSSVRCAALALTIAAAAACSRGWPHDGEHAASPTRRIPSLMRRRNCQAVRPAQCWRCGPRNSSRAVEKTS